MLILGRKTDEKIVIQGDIVITILGIEGGSVKLGISAPKEVQIYREEVWQAIQEQTRIAEELAELENPAGFDDLRTYLAQEMLLPENAPENAG
jgi:carbon storage regulator